MKTLLVDIKNKVATYKSSDTVICDNCDYEIQFSFDSDWDHCVDKKARFIWDDQYKDEPIVDNKCSIPVIHNAPKNMFKVGVWCEDTHTTTAATIRCKDSVLSDDPEPSKEQYFIDTVHYILRAPVPNEAGDELTQYLTALNDTICSKEDSNGADTFDPQGFNSRIAALPSVSQHQAVLGLLEDIERSIHFAESFTTAAKWKSADRFDNNMPVYEDGVIKFKGNWSCGYINTNSDYRYYDYDGLSDDGNWLTHNRDIWGGFGGIGITDWHSSYRYIGCGQDRHSTVIRYTCPIDGIIKISFVDGDLLNGTLYSTIQYTDARGNMDPVPNCTNVLVGRYGTIKTYSSYNSKLSGIRYSVKAGAKITFKFDACPNDETAMLMLIPAITYLNEDDIDPSDYCARIEALT